MPVSGAVIICTGNYSDTGTTPLGLDLTSEMWQNFLVMIQLCITALSLTGADEMLSILMYFSALFRCRTWLKYFIMATGDSRLKQCVGFCFPFSLTDRYLFSQKFGERRMKGASSQNCWVFFYSKCICRVKPGISASSIAWCVGDVIRHISKMNLCN